MSRLDELIAQCQAAPNSDAPRLVWADAVGGERGELVVLQCRLASGATLNRDEWRQLRARERELLAANGAAWSGLADEKPCSFAFRRGFIDSVQIVCTHDSRLDGILSMVPLAHSLSNELVDQDDHDFARLAANPRSTDFAALRIGSSSAAAGDRAIRHLVERGVALRALSVSNCSRAGARLLADSGLLASVERLALGAIEDGPRMVSAAPRLRALYIRGAFDGYAAAIPRTVVEFGCHVSGGIDAVAALTIAPTLERLRVESLEFTWDFEALAAFRALRSLDLFRANPGPRYRAFAMDRPNVLPSLRELSLGLWVDELSLEPIARALGPQLDLLHWSGRVPSGASIHAMHAPLIAGDAGLAAHVDGEFVVGIMPPWGSRPLEFGDDSGMPWFEMGIVAVRS